MKNALYIGSIFLMIMSSIGVVSVTAQTNVEQSTDKKDLMALIDRAVNAQVNFDAATLETIYASDYIEISPAGEVDPREKAIGFYRSIAANSSDQIKMAVTTDHFSIRTYGKFALVVARVTFTHYGSPTQRRPPVSFRSMYVCRKENGNWKIGSVQMTGIRPSQPQQPQ